MSIFDVYAVAAQGRRVNVPERQFRQIDLAQARVREWVAKGQPVYGVNTGFGELSHVALPPELTCQVQYHLLYSHAAGGGEHFPDDIVRAMMATRLNYLVKGYAGVSRAAVALEVELLNRHLTPLVPEQGSVGASGDLAPLAHLALPLIGQGWLRAGDRTERAAAVLAREGLEPISLGPKEALALINGTSGMSGAAAVALVRAFDLLNLAVIATASVVQLLRGSVAPFVAIGHELKPHAGQMMVAKALRSLLGGSSLTRTDEDLVAARRAQRQSSPQPRVSATAIPIQNAYSLRCTPQILGAVLDALNFCREIVETEVNSCNDNPLVLEGGLPFHGGNFHGQYVAMVCDFLNIALAEIGVLAERQLNRLLDPHLNDDLPPFLAAADPGLHSGFAGAQYLATSIAAENVDLAAPVSIKSIPSNGENQDVVSMGLISARRSLRLCDNVLTILSVLIAACQQAAYHRGIDSLSLAGRTFHTALGVRFAAYRDDGPIGEPLSELRMFLRGEGGRALIARTINFTSRIDGDSTADVS